MQSRRKIKVTSQAGGEKLLKLRHAVSVKASGASWFHIHVVVKILQPGFACNTLPARELDNKSGQ